MSKPEKLNWFTQKPGSVVCGAVAILNAKLWQGNSVQAAELPKLVKELGISKETDGISGSNLDRYIRQKRNFGVDRLIQPTAARAKSYLDKDVGFILRYIWELDDRRGAHYVFVCSGSRNRVLVANPHRLSIDEEYEPWRYFSPGEFEACFKRTQIGNRYYPWIWPITA